MEVNAGKSLLQAIVKQCNITFKQANYKGPNYDANLKYLQNLTSQVTKEHLNVKRPSKPLPSPGIAFANIINNDVLTVGLFYISKGKHIPLHDHPEMTVITKLLYGRVEIKAHDLVVDESNNKNVLIHGNGGIGSIYRATRATSKILDESEVDEHKRIHTTLPRTGNIHSFIALSDCCIIDIIGPSYKAGVRDCHYYECVEAGKFDSLTKDQRQSIMEHTADNATIHAVAEIEHDFYCIQFRYSGPQAIDPTTCRSKN